MLKKIYLAIIIATITAITANASHLMGGEITWKCQANGSFKFFMKIYRDCNGITFIPVAEIKTTHPIGTIPLSLIVDIRMI